MKILGRALDLFESGLDLDKDTKPLPKKVSHTPLSIATTTTSLVLSALAPPPQHDDPSAFGLMMPLLQSVVGVSVLKKPRYL